MGGWLSANDIREQLGMEPVPGGDVYIRPLNYVDATTATAAEGIETDNDPADTSPDDDKPAAVDPDAQAAKVATNLISQSLNRLLRPANSNHGLYLNLSSMMRTAGCRIGQRKMLPR
jgi:hypothetical protein